MKMVWEKWAEKVKEGSKFECRKNLSGLRFLSTDKSVFFKKGKKYSVIKMDDQLLIATLDGGCLLPGKGNKITWEFIAEYFVLVEE